MVKKIENVGLVLNPDAEPPKVCILKKI